ncbi:class I SAM-dependent methyltransferase [Synechocystis sp. LKSZ1]|uniref:class I SAM-dependent methyltransferase n=1 Tax=Synechocystis sp. LKSZ1 TaxID=3144951 RepID=UPI00336BCDD8
MNISDLQKKWEYLAEVDPLWAILSDDTKKGGKWNIDEFFQVGRKDAQNFINLAKHIHPNLNYGKALDFGCGVGRLTQGHASFFEKIIGVDVSTRMIELANKLNQHQAKISYLANNCSSLHVFDDNSFDYIICHIVLQHTPPTIHQSYIQEFVRILKPNGFCIFQLPEPFPESWGSERFDETSKDKLDMYGTSKEEVIEIVKSRNGHILDVEDDGSCGPDHKSNRYCFTV